jgi:choline kinase
MVEYKVLITTSGLGSRLGQLTDYTNKCLVRIADKPAISYIIESYPEQTEFVISLGHFGDHVKQFLSLAYPERNFTYIEIDNYKGDGSSLGYSILQCKQELQCPFIFHASDTILLNTEITTPTQNYVLGAYKEDSSQYRTLNLNAGKVVRINEKDEIGFDYSYVGVAGIKDYQLFFTHLESLIQAKHRDTSDVHAINMMTLDVEFKYNCVECNHWFDIGNTTELARTRKSFYSNIKVLDKKDESIFFFDKFVIKFFADNTINRNRVKRAYELDGLVPQIIDSTQNFYKYHKAEGQLFAKSVNRSKFVTFLDWTKSNLWAPKEGVAFQEKCYDFYITKTKKRIEQYIKVNSDSESVINGELVPTAMDLINRVDAQWLCDGIPSQFHGDFILDNIIETTDGFTLIDWRQDFANDLVVGDLYYDLAKLNHNLNINHDIVNRGLFDHSKDNCHILINSKLNECKGVLHSFIQQNGYDLNKIKILTSIIWINMAPLHEYPFSNFLFNFGKYNLHKQLNLTIW